MTLKDKLMDDLKESMKNKEQVRKSVVTLIRSAVKFSEFFSKSTNNRIISCTFQKV